MPSKSAKFTVKASSCSSDIVYTHTYVANVGNAPGYPADPAVLGKLVLLHASGYISPTRATAAAVKEI